MNDPIALWVTPVSNLAGVARHILDVVRVGVPGWRLVVTAPEGPLLERLRAMECPVIPLPVEGVSTATTVAALRHTLKRLRPQIAHSHLAKADILLAMASVGLPIPLVTTEHHIPPDRFMFHTTLPAAMAMETVHRLRLTRFSHAIAVSASTKRDMLKYWRTKTPITVILNGVDRPEAMPARQPGLRMLSLTRLSPEKNLDMTLRVFRLVLKEHPDATLTIAGTGDDERRLRLIADELGLGDRVEFPGFVDAEVAMASHDVLLQPSKSDNCSYTLLDAVAKGMGVAASPIGGNPEILPAHCIARLDDDAGMARIAIEQGRNLGRRPALSDAVPAVAGMARRISDVYECALMVESPAPPVLADWPAHNEPCDDETPAPRVTVVIPYFRNADLFPAQLTALTNQVDPPPFEVVIADNEGSTELPGIVRAFAEQLRLRLVSAWETPGVGFAVNVGFQEAAAPLVIKCDSDDEVGPRWVQAMSKALNEHDALVTGPVRLDRLNSEFVWRTYLGIDQDEAVDLPVLQRPFVFLDYKAFAIGANFGIRRATFWSLGGMNTKMPGGTEDVDFSWRAQEAGVPIVVSADATVDYRLRTNAKAIFRQRRGYQRSQLQLWAISRRLGRPVKPMSLRWALTETIKLPYGWLQVRNASEERRYRFAAVAGGVIGNLEGQLLHRVLPHMAPSPRRST